LSALDDRVLARSDERPQSQVRGRRRRPRMRLGVIALIAAAACAMVTSIVLYVEGVASHSVPTHGTPASGGTTVTFDVVAVSNNYTELVGDLIVKPGPALLDPATDGLKQDLTVAVTSTTTPIRRTWSKGMLPGVFPVPITLARDVERWPFDSYYTGPITVELFTGATKVPERANVTFVDRLSGWKAHVTRVNNANPLAPYEVDLQRSPSTMMFAIVILCIFVAIAAVGLLCDSDASRPTQVSVADDNLVRSDAVCGGTAEKRTSGLADIRKLDRPHDRLVGTGGFGGLDAALYRGLVASDI